MRADQLNTHDPRFYSADHEKQKPVDYVQCAEPLVIDGGNPLVERIHKGTRYRLRPWHYDGISRHPAISPARSTRHSTKRLQVTC